MEDIKKQKKKGIHLLTRIIIFMIFIASVPLVIAAYSVKNFSELHQKDIDARQTDIANRIIRDIRKEFKTSSTSEVEIRARLGKVISEDEISRTGYIYITDERGILLATTKKDATGEVDLSANPIVGSTLFQGTIKIEGQKRYESYWGEPVIGSGTSTIENISGTPKKLGIFVELPAYDADILFTDLVRKFLLFTFFAFFITAILSYYLANKIVSPIRELQMGTKRVVEEKFDEPVKVNSGDEIEDLGEAFNTMMGGLKELKELREEFVFVAAHELRTPVTAIKGFIQLVLEDQTNAVTGTTREYLQKAIAANERLIQLVNDLLEVAREEAGRLEIEVRPTNIVDAIQPILGELAPLAKEKQITIEYSPLANAPLVLADARRIGEVVTNLAGNSIKYMGGSGSVKVFHEKIGNKIVTHIADTGTGISKEAQTKLFEKFYRVYNEKTKEVKGTGLGLFIVKKIIEKMGGKIWVTSPTLPGGIGTTFSFELPITK